MKQLVFCMDKLKVKYLRVFLNSKTSYRRTAQSSSHRRMKPDKITEQEYYKELDSVCNKGSKEQQSTTSQKLIGAKTSPMSPWGAAHSLLNPNRQWQCQETIYLPMR